MINIDRNDRKIVGCFFAVWLMFCMATIPAWFTHIAYCIDQREWVFLLSGAICPPIGVVHGWGLWFGWW